MIFKFDNFAAFRVGTPPQLRITEDLLIAEEQLILLESSLVDEILDPLRFESNVAVGTFQLSDSAIVNLNEVVRTSSLRKLL